MSIAMGTLEELSIHERHRNKKAAEVMIKDRWYKFDPPAETVPLEHRNKGSKRAGESVKFSRGKYMAWRKESEEHMFLGITEDGETMFCPIFLCGGVACVEDTNQSDANIRVS